MKNKLNLFEEINLQITNFKLEEAYVKTKKLMEESEKIHNEKIKSLYISNIASFLIDIGHLSRDMKIINEGLNILTENSEIIKKTIPEHEYTYNLANAKLALIKKKKQDDMNFDDIIKINEVKNLYWKSYKESYLENKEVKPELLVNLANTLKLQFRLVESINYYDIVNNENGSIFQSWINRSETLFMLNNISNSYSIKQLEEIKKGYVKSCIINKNNTDFNKFYKECISWIDDKIKKIKKDNKILDNIEDELQTIDEYNKLSDYKKFCLDNRLMLSEHSLYCNCINASEDNLSIIPQTGGVIGDFIPSMEMALNRLKSEYYLARKQYFEYIESINNYYSYDDEFYSELYNSELLNINIEKLKSSFKLCFGIFDKIAVAISKAYNIKNKKSFYFHNFWELGDNNRKAFFESIKSPGLLSLFSIAMDLNNKEGELGFFRNWRNALEHKFIIIYSGNSTEDLYDSYSYFNDIEFINEKDFLENFKLLINITRSAIFSFVFAIRHKGNENLEKNKNISFKNTINKKII